MDLSNLESDISLDVARAAHHHTSFVPEQRAVQDRQSYAETLTADYKTLREYTLEIPENSEDRLAILEDEFARYRQGYRNRFIAMLQGMSRCASTMITGRSNFNVHRHEKANAADDKKREELTSYRKWALEHIRKLVRPDLAPILSSDGDACERLEDKISKAEKRQELMKAANKIIHGKPKNEQTHEKISALTRLGFSPGVAEELFKPDFCGRVGFAGFELTNNNANIRRMKDRLGVISENQAKVNTTVEGAAGVRIEESPADNRLRLFFPGKPGVDERTELKRHGFRWTPSLGCWQAYLNGPSREFARRYNAEGAVHS